MQASGGAHMGATRPGGQGETFEAALTAGSEVRAAAVAAGPRLPRKDLSRLYPSTMQDAVSVVHARLEENKKKAAASKQKSKSKSGAPHTPSESHFPGARAGGGEPSAFWMYIEDYFRDFTQDDLRALLPLIRDPRDDPALKVPPCGRRVEDEQQQRKHAAARAAAEAAKAAAAAASWDLGAVDSKPSGGLDGTSPDVERRSSRLVSRHCKEEEQRRQWEVEAQALAAAAAAEQAEAAAAAAAAHAMAVVPTTASGAPAEQLLDVLPEQRLALLLQQLDELQQLTGHQSLAAAAAACGASAAVQAALAKLLGGANGSAAELEPAVRRELQTWLAQRLGELAGHIGCVVSTLPPWAGKPPPSKQNEAAGQQGAAGAAAASGAAARWGEGRGGKEPVAAAEAAEAAGLGVTADSPAAQLATAAYLHPYTELMLAHPVQQHTVQQATEVQGADQAAGVSRQATMGPLEAAAAAVAAAAAEGGGAGGDAAAAALGAAAAAAEAATPGASLITATPRSASLLAEAPSVANFSTLSEPHTAAAGDDDAEAAGAADTAGTAGLAGMGTPAALALGLDSQAAGSGSGAAVADGLQADGATAAAGVGEGQLAASGAPPSRSGSRARGVSNYALLAGKKSSSRAATGPPKKAVRTQAAKQEHEAVALHPVARAVSALVAAGEPERSPAEQWGASMAPPGPALLAAAPEDEVLAEMLALQNELMQQAAVNRARLVPALAGVLGDLDERLAAAEQRAAEEEEVKAWILKLREIKRQQTRQRREQAHQEALAAKKQSIMASPRPVLGRQRGSFQAELDAAAVAAAVAGGAGGSGGEPAREGSPPLEYALRADELYDVLAQRSAEQEAFCAVCGDGHSEAPNQIVFCERCDVAVHQQCYGVAVLPEGEWLCEPCREYEELKRAQGVPEAEIRPSSWQTDPHNRPPLEGGSRSVKCACCPIKYGAFKKTEDGRRWVHSACALWLPETSISHREVPGLGRQEFVVGLDKIRPERWEARCAICGLADGAVMNCQQPGGCNTCFHVLCARNIGLHLIVRPDLSRKSAVQYRAYCALHSAAQQARDEKQWRERQERVAQQQQKESKVKAAERAAVAKQALAAQEEERRQLSILRANMEMCRMLIDVTKRRERLKKQVVVLQLQQWPLLQREDPTAALALVQVRQRQAAEQQEAQAIADVVAAAGASVGPGTSAGTGAGADADADAALQQPTSALLGFDAAAAAAAAATVSMQQQQPPQLPQLPQLPAFTLQPPLPIPPAAAPTPPPQQQAQQKVQPQQQQAQQQPQPQRQTLPVLQGLPPLADASSAMAFFTQQQQQFLSSMPLPQAPPSFALDMFEQQAGGQQQQQGAAQQLPFMLPPPMPPPAQQQHQPGTAGQKGQGAGPSAATTAALGAFPGFSLQLPPGTGGLAWPSQPQQQPQQQQQQLMMIQGVHELPATAAGMLVPAAGGVAATAQVPPEVAVMLGASAPGLMPPLQLPLGLPQQQQPQQQSGAAQQAQHTQHAQQAQQQQPPGEQQRVVQLPIQQQLQQQYPSVDPAVAAMLAGQPVLPAIPMPPPATQAATDAGAAAAAAAGGGGGGGGTTPRGTSPQPQPGSGRPRRATAGQGGSHKRRRGSSEEPAAAALPPAAAAGGRAAAGVMPPPPPPMGAGPDLGGAAAAAGRRQRTASVKVRENLLQRERQMTAEEAEALNAQLPGALRYMPAAELAELEASLGPPAARAGSRAGAGQRQAKSRSRGGGGGGGR